MFSWFKKRNVNKVLSSINKKSPMEQIADDVLKDAVIESTRTKRAAEKLLKAKLLNNSSKSALRSVEDLDDEEEDDEEEDDEGDELADGLMKEFFNNYIKPKLSPSGVPESVEKKASSLQDLAVVYENLSPEDKAKIAERFGK